MLTMADKAMRAYEIHETADCDRRPKRVMVGWDVFEYLGAGIDRSAFRSLTDGLVYKISKFNSFDGTQSIIEDEGFSWAREQGISWVPDTYITSARTSSGYDCSVTVSEYCPTNDMLYSTLERTHKAIWTDINFLAGDIHSGNVGFRQDGSPVLIDGGRFRPEQAEDVLNFFDTPDFNRTVGYQPSYVAAMVNDVLDNVQGGCNCDLCQQFS